MMSIRPTPDDSVQHRRGTVSTFVTILTGIIALAGGIAAGVHHALNQFASPNVSLALAGIALLATTIGAWSLVRWTVPTPTLPVLR